MRKDRKCEDRGRRSSPDSQALEKEGLQCWRQSGGPEKLCREGAARAVLEQYEERVIDENHTLPYKAHQCVPSLTQGLLNITTGTLTARHHRKSWDSQLWLGENSEEHPHMAQFWKFDFWRSPLLPPTTSGRQSTSCHSLPPVDRVFLVLIWTEQPHLAFRSPPQDRFCLLSLAARGSALLLLLQL
ncbi:hypothetical protein ACRRTK_020282 [Alexandromys fortis]